MKVGDKWMLYIPPELAYGNRGMGPIPPGSLPTFEVELLDVLPPAAAKPAVKKSAPGPARGLFPSAARMDLTRCNIPAIIHGMNYPSSFRC